jgi:hypothetical protein
MARFARDGRELGVASLVDLPRPSNNESIWKITDYEIGIEVKSHRCAGTWRKDVPTKSSYDLIRWTSGEQSAKASCAIDFAVSEDVTIIS